MKFYHRLDFQLTLIFLAILSLTVSLTGWVHSRGHLINQIGPFIHFSQDLNTLKPSVETFLGENNLPNFTAMVQTFQKQDPESLFLICNEAFDIVSHTSPEDSFIEMVRHETDLDYFVVVTSSIVKRFDFILFYRMVPALEMTHKGKRYFLIKIPRPRLIDPPPMKPILFEGVRHHFKIYGLVYSAVMVFFIVFIRLRLKPLRAIEQAAKQLTDRQMPGPVPSATQKDEVGQLVNAFNTALNQLAHQEEVRKQMVADIAHELRTPLTNVCGRIEAYQDGLISSSEEVIAFAGSQMNHLTHIVNDLALLNASDAGTLTIQWEEFPLRKAIEDLLDAHNLEQRFEWQVSGEEIDVRLDLQRFRQIMTNLITNAAQAKEYGLVIKVSISQTLDNVQLRFQDNGPGVRQQDLERIFRRLYRPDEARSQHNGGSGLGLSIVATLVAAQKGTVRSFLVPTGGLGFELTFPQNTPI